MKCNGDLEQQKERELECYGDKPFMAWLIEKDSPAKYYRGSKRTDYEPTTSCPTCTEKNKLIESFKVVVWWDLDANEAVHFQSEQTAKWELERLVAGGVESDMRIIDHMFNCGVSERKVKPAPKEPDSFKILDIDGEKFNIPNKVSELIMTISAERDELRGS